MAAMLYSFAPKVQTAAMAVESHAIYKDLLIVLGAAGVAIPLLRRLGMSSIPGFLLAGVALGPHVLGYLANQLPVLAPLELRESGGFAGLAELGVVFLLFLIGLELSPERLRTMRQLVFGLGGTQVILASLVIAALAALWGYDASQAAVIGMALSLSSTAIVIQLFADDKRLGSQAGRISFAVLLMQDLCVVPMLLLLGTLGPGADGNLVLNVGLAVLQALTAAAFIVLAGRYVLTPLLRLVAASDSTDLFMASVLFIAIGLSALAAAAGLSMSLGAFIAGLALAETEFRRAIEAIIEPFKGVLLGLFFLLVGLGLDLNLLFEQPLLIVEMTVLIISVKTAIFMGLALVMKLPRAPALESALLLSPGGEFAFVLFGAAAAAGLFTPAETAPLLISVTLSMMLIPLLGKVAKIARSKLPKPAASAGKYQLPEQGVHGPHVIIAGFGRVGRIVAAMLKEQGLPLIGIDLDLDNIAAARKLGHAVYYGDAADIAFLKRCGLAGAKALAITMDNPARTQEILGGARSTHPALKIIARARDERHAIKLYEAGVTEAVPETTEASLQLAEALLVEMGVPMGLAIAAVHEARDSYRKLLGRPNRKAEAARKRSRLKSQLKRS
jgi:Kef-type K+ transport system membrane component KefB/voltage-gated potassium channel Kch